jgi:3-phenylpropionate/trans-cinnamate dioxygenase ferredoxin subunit
VADFQRACAVTDVTDGGAVRVTIDGVPVAVVRSDGEVYAIHDVCSHANVSLAEGEVDGCTVECWLHGSRFDLRTGRPTSLPAIRPIAVYPVRIEGGTVLVDVEAPLTPEQIAAQAAEQDLEPTAVKEH